MLINQDSCVLWLMGKRKRSREDGNQCIQNNADVLQHPQSKKRLTFNRDDFNENADETNHVSDEATSLLNQTEIVISSKGSTKQSQLWGLFPFTQKMVGSKARRRVNNHNGADVTLNITKKPGIGEVQKLLLWLFNSEVFKRPKFGAWIQVPPQIRDSIRAFGKCLIAVLPYLDKTTFDDKGSQYMPFLYRHREKSICMKSAFVRPTSRSCTIVEAILMKPADKEKLGQLCSNNTDQTNTVGIASLLLKNEDLIGHDFPLKFIDWGIEFTDSIFDDHLSCLEKPDAPNIKLTIPGVTQEELFRLRNDPEFDNLLSLDCEMCETREGKQVTRISVVRPVITIMSKSSDALCDEVQYQLEMEVVLDSLVKPNGIITDYLVRFSGVSEEDLKNVTITLKDVQKKLFDLIKPETIIVGHSVDNDLLHLHIFHPRIIDSSVIYPHPALGLKNSLKYLARNFLQRSIRKCVNAILGQSNRRGHDSIEDAQVPLELVLLKSLRPLDFGVGRVQHYATPFCSLFESSLPSLSLYDSLVHDRELVPLRQCLPYMDLIESVDHNDHMVVLNFIEAQNNERDIEGIHSICPIHVCMIRDYQRLCHESMIGGIDERNRPSDVYCISKRVDRLIDTLTKSEHEAQKRPMSPPMSPSSTIDNTAELNDVIEDWLGGAFGTKTALGTRTLKHRSEGDTVTETPEEISSRKIPPEDEDEDEEEEDKIGKEWIDKHLQFLRGSNPFAEKIAAKSKLSTLKTIDDNLLLLYSKLSPGDFFIVLSPCGNPIPYLGLSRLIARLERQKTEFGAKQFFPSISDLEHAKQLNQTLKNDAFGLFMVRS